MIGVTVIALLCTLRIRGNPFTQWSSDTGCLEAMGDLAYLGQHNINCSSSVMRSYGMRSAAATGCSGSNREIGFTCTESAISSSETRYTSCDEANGKALSYLERQDVDCNVN